MTDYTTLANLKLAMSAQSLATNANDDTWLEQLIDAASVWIDNESGKVFVSASATRYYSIPADGGRKLSTGDDWFTSVTSVTNGDGTVIPATEYYLSPRNTPQHNAIVLEGSSSYGWNADSNGNTEEVIAIVAVFGWSTACPADIRTACESICINWYRNRGGIGNEGAATITGAGVVITPRDIPAGAREIVRKYRGVL